MVWGYWMGLSRVLCSGLDFSGISGEAILHLSVLTPDASWCRLCLSPSSTLNISVKFFRQELSVFVFLHGTELLLFAVTVGSPASPLAGAAPPEAQLLGCCLGAAEQVTH